LVLRHVAWIGFALALGSASLAGAADIAALRSRWQDLLVQDPTVLAPRRYSEAATAYKAFEDAVRRTDTDIDARAETAAARMNALDAALARLRAEWPDVLQARSDARAAHAPDTRPREWRNAENVLAAAAQKLEVGRAQAGARQAGEAKQLYQSVRLLAVQGDVLGAARAAVQQLEAGRARTYVPRSYVRALDALHVAEAALQPSGPDPGARAATARAVAEAGHAQFLLDRIRGACEEGDAARLESTLLDWEDGVRRLLAVFGEGTDFEAGLGPDLALAERRCTDLVHERDVLRGNADQSAKDSDSLRVSVQAAHDSLNALALRFSSVERTSSEYEKLLNVQQLFDRADGRVLLDNRDVVLRLPGVVFEAGNADLGDAARAVLDKVVRALALYPGALVIVEGHTDSRGNPATNDALSLARANAVRTYLIQEAALKPQRVTAAGKGSSRPVAAETDEAGRALNRRIEITISPAK
jgi:OOP family OmpA-OmpF porin